MFVWNSSCSQEGSVFHGCHRHPSTLRCQEESCPRRQDGQTRGMSISYLGHTRTHQTVGVLNVCLTSRPERRSPQWTQSSTPRGFTISSPLSCHSLEERWRGGAEARGKRRTSVGEVMEQKPKTSRGAVVVFIHLPFIFSPSSFLRFSLHKWNATLQLQKKSIIRLHLTSPYFVCYFGG